MKSPENLFLRVRESEEKGYEERDSTVGHIQHQPTYRKKIGYGTSTPNTGRPLTRGNRWNGTD